MSEAIPQIKPPAKGIEGIFLIDKPSGISSHGVVNTMRKITGIHRIGHTGTLDPLASGLLIILVGKDYTRLQDTFLKQDKTYTFTAQLGIETDTYDSTGVVQRKVEWELLQKITQEDLENTLPSFRGTFTQTVPSYSAIKQHGKKLYDKAINKTLDLNDLPQREVTIDSLVLKEFVKNEKEKTLLFSLEASVSSGTYIRSLVYDIGKKLKVGAMVKALRRTRIGEYSIEKAHSIFDLKTFSFGKIFLLDRSALKALSQSNQTKEVSA